MTFGTFAFKIRTEHNRKLRTAFLLEMEAYKKSIAEGITVVKWQNYPHKPLYLTLELFSIMLGFSQRNGWQRLEQSDREWEPIQKEALAEKLGLSLKELEAEYEAWVDTREEAEC